MEYLVVVEMRKRFLLWEGEAHSIPAEEMLVQVAEAVVMVRVGVVMNKRMEEAAMAMVMVMEVAMNILMAVAGMETEMEVVVK